MRTLFDKLRGHRSHTFYFAFDDTELRMRASQVVIANAGTMGAPPFTWGPHIDPSDGVLDLCVLTIHRSRDYLQIARNVLTGHRRTPSTRYFRIHERIAIRTVVPMPVHADGETLGTTPVVIELVPDALKVVVPSASQ
jgi:diacylglycerol kinase family enzyme